MPTHYVVLGNMCYDTNIQKIHPNGTATFLKKVKIRIRMKKGKRKIEENGNMYIGLLNIESLILFMYHVVSKRLI